jgi:hypothetical protein
MTSTMGFLRILALAWLMSRCWAAGLDAFIAREREIALQGALDNIGPNGAKVPGAHAGLVVASPSKVNPNCASPMANPSRNAPSSN